LTESTTRATRKASKSDFSSPSPSPSLSLGNGLCGHQPNTIIEG
jgi:hypothetical protein